MNISEFRGGFKNVFGWNINKWEGSIDYWLIDTGLKDKPRIGSETYFREPEGNVIGILENDPKAQ